MSKFMVTAAALVGLALGSSADATPVYLNYSGTGFVYDGLGQNSFSFTVAYDPALQSSDAVKVYDAFFTISRRVGSQFSPSESYSAGSGTGRTFISQSPGLNYNVGSKLLDLFASNGSNSLGIRMAIDNSGFPQGDFRFGSGNGSYTVGQNSYFIEQLFVRNTTAVPEPLTWALMLTGIGGVGGSLRLARQKKRADHTVPAIA